MPRNQFNSLSAKLFFILEHPVAWFLALVEVETDYLFMEKEITLQIELQIKKHASPDPPYFHVFSWDLEVGNALKYYTIVPF